MSASDTSVQKPTLENRRETITPSSGRVTEPRAKADAPHNTVAGVLGITRMTRISDGNIWNKTQMHAAYKSIICLHYFCLPGPVCHRPSPKLFNCIVTVTVVVNTALSYQISLVNASLKNLRCAETKIGLDLVLKTKLSKNLISIHTVFWLKLCRYFLMLSSYPHAACCARHQSSHVHILYI